MFVSLWCVLELSVNRGGVECVLWLRLQMNETASTAYVSCNVGPTQFRLCWSEVNCSLPGDVQGRCPGSIQEGQLKASRRK